MKKKRPTYKANADWLKSVGSNAIVSRPKPINGIEITILGCGSSTGVPLLSCRCKVCTSNNPKNNRTRASISIQVNDKVFLIDTSPDLRSQAIREKLFWVDAVLFTHVHADHTHGIDELRSYNFLMRKVIDCYGSRHTIKAIREKFDYIFKYTQEGGGKPAIDLHHISKPQIIEGVRVVPLPVSHGNIEVLGFRINNVAYITDTSYIPEPTLKCLKNLDVLILDCLRPASHPTHINIEQAISYAMKIGAKKTIFTHMTHEVEYGSFKKSLPKNMVPAFDGMKERSK